MVSQSFMTTYFWGTYIWFLVGFLIVGISAIKEIITLLFCKKEY